MGRDGVTYLKPLDNIGEGYITGIWSLIYNYISALRDYPIDFYYFKEGVSVYGICFKQRWTTTDADEQAR